MIACVLLLPWIIDAAEEPIVWGDAVTQIEWNATAEATSSGVRTGAVGSEPEGSVGSILRPFEVRSTDPDAACERVNLRFELTVSGPGYALVRVERSGQIIFSKRIGSGTLADGKALCLKTGTGYKLLVIADSYSPVSGSGQVTAQVSLGLSISQSEECMPAPLDNVKLEALLRLDEGVRDTVYLDTEGHPTIGIGFNLDRPGAKKALQKVGADYAKVRAGTESLTDEQIQTLFEADLAKAIQLGRAIVHGKAFDELPESVKEVVVDMTFNLNGKLRNFKKMLSALRRGDLQTAAAELEDSKFYTQVGDRGPRLKALLLQCAQ